MGYQPQAFVRQGDVVPAACSDCNAGGFLFGGEKRNQERGNYSKKRVVPRDTLR
jgi:hypothetical protein